MAASRLEPGLRGGPDVTVDSAIVADESVPDAASLIAYGVAYIAWFVEFGVIIDRISVGISVAILLVIGHIGRPWRAWLRLPLDLALYAAMWFAYDETRGAADRVGMPLQVESVINIDRALFVGTDPVVWLQDNFHRDRVGIHDVIASIEYFSHFVIPPAMLAMLWISNCRLWARCMRRFATVLAVACAMFVLLPTAPPWMAAGGSRAIPLDALPPLRRTAGRGWEHIGLDGFIHVWVEGRDWANPTAAMPSLHAAFALFVVLFAWPFVRRRWVRIALLVHPVLMGLSLVYLAEHYVIDVLVGWAVVVLTFWAWDRIEARWQRRRPDGARDCEPDGERVDPDVLTVG
jgi:membrane-associated phospholipid phosphatase